MAFVDHRHRNERLKREAFRHRNKRIKKHSPDPYNITMESKNSNQDQGFHQTSPAEAAAPPPPPPQQEQQQIIPTRAGTQDSDTMDPFSFSLKRRDNVDDGMRIENYFVYLSLRHFLMFV